jgi:hypothetical protein
MLRRCSPALIVIATAGWLSASAATAQSPASQPTGSAPAPVQFWPPDDMVDALLRSWATAATEAYDLTPAQQRQVETQLRARWPKFLTDNRDDLQPLLNEYLETRLAGAAPAAETARNWARRGLPLVEKLQAFVEEGNTHLSGVLTAEQRSKFAADRARLGDGLKGLRTQLQAWEGGNYREEEWWKLARPEPATQRAERTPPRKATSAPRAQALTEFDLEMVAWDGYVRDFMARYELDDGQRKAAESILVEMKARARAYYHSRRLRIAAMEELIHYPRLETTQADIRAQLVELYGPIDEMFAELQRRLQLIPTEAQKSLVEPLPSAPRQGAAPADPR